MEQIKQISLQSLHTLLFFFFCRTTTIGFRSTGLNMEMEAFWTLMICCVTWLMTKIGWVQTYQKTYRFAKDFFFFNFLWFSFICHNARFWHLYLFPLHFSLCGVWLLLNSESCAWKTGIAPKVLLTCASDYTCLLLHYCKTETSQSSKLLNKSPCC